jgi:uncharacterized protein YyaL (SSP411 family)
VIVGEDGAEDTKALILALRSQYLPSVIVMQFSPGSQAEALVQIAPFTQNLSMVDGKATAYVCSGHECSLPVTDPTSVLGEIDRVKKQK